MNNFDDMNEENGEFIPVIADGGVPEEYKLDKTEGLMTLALRREMRVRMSQPIKIYMTLVSLEM